MTEPSDELDHLDKQAERGADSPQFHEVNKKVFSLLPEVKQKDSKILDFGCGPGRLTIMLAKSPNVESVLGTDISEVMISRAIKYSEEEEDADVRKKLTFKTTSRHPKAELEPLKGSMDLVVMSFVLGHIAPRKAGEEVLATAASTLKQGGQFALAEFAYSEEGTVAGAGGPDQHHGGHSHDHSHSHHHHHHDHEGGSGEEEGDKKSHHGGHIAFLEEDVRRMFKASGLEPAETFVPFEFEWHGTTIKSMMAVGTKI